MEKRSRLEPGSQITFRVEEAKFPNHDDALVVSVRIANARVKRVIVDTGSSADVLYFEVFKRLGITKGDLTPLASSLTGFMGDFVSPLETTLLPITIGEEPRTETIMTTFIVVDLPSAYNVILDRPTLNKLKAVISTYHHALKFLTSSRVGVVRSDPKESRQCYLTAVTMPKRPRPIQPPLDPRNDFKTPRHSESTEQLVEVLLRRGRPDKVVKVGMTLPEADQIQLVNFLKENADVFVWYPEDMLGVNPQVMQHHLNICHEAHPIKQRPRKFAPDRQKAIDDEVDRLMGARFISEVRYPRWLSNIVLVKKPNGSWRMCVDYTDFNRACPKDCYPLPRIDHLVDATVGHELLTFMDAFLGYNQIQMAP
ncbi:uncharacterized protein LOC135611986 [Musa acuminata AAA Group]|uniref:uncharacterized protein LOC135604845 n=1 Tax=Musa acuminata AAA Group TaxID=214697 RepID=UPI0031D206B6